MKRYQSTTREFRKHLRDNGIPLKYELDDEADYENSLRNHITYYGRMYGPFLPRDMDAQILEIGCSEGLFLGFLKHAGYVNYRGIDLAQEKLAISSRSTDARGLRALGLSLVGLGSETIHVF